MKPIGEASNTNRYTDENSNIDRTSRVDRGIVEGFRKGILF